MTDVSYLKVAEIFANESKCEVWKVGAVVVKEGRIISTGYNGTLPGETNCCNKWGGTANANRKQHSQWSLENEIHAEMNAILMAAKNGISVKGATVYSTLQPCNQCLLMIIMAGIKKIVFRDIYDRVEYSEDILSKIKNSRVELVHLPTQK